MLLEREMRGDAARNYRSRALEEAIGVERLKEGLLKEKEICVGMQQEAIEVEMKKGT